MRFGIFPSPRADRHADVVGLVQQAERDGLDLVGIQDHPYQRRFLDTFVLMADLLARTERVTVFPDVANLPLRGAAMIAKAAASLDVMSSGRFELGLGAGGFWDAIEAFGGVRRTPGEAVTAVEEAIPVMRAIWSGERSLHEGGDTYRLDGAQGGPPPAHDLGIWVGAAGSRMLSVTGRIADGWLPSSPWLPPEQLASRHAIIDQAAADAGRDPAEVTRLYNISGTITDGPTEEWLVGGPDHWVEQVTELAVEHRIEAVILMPDDRDPAGQVRSFAEIADEVRSRLPDT